MDKSNFPELEQTSDLELLRARKELLELKAKVDKYEQILKENDLLDSVPTQSDVEVLCRREIARLNELSAKNIPLSLEDVKIFDVYVKNLFLSQGKVVPVEKSEKKGKGVPKPDEVAKLLQLAGSREE